MKYAHIQGGIVKAKALTGSFMVHSVMAVSRISKVRRDFGQAGNDFRKEQKKANTSFSEVLKKEVEGVRKESSSCGFVTYGMDRQLHFQDYRTREYYN